MSTSVARQRSRGVLLVTGGVLLISFDALLVKLAAVDGWNVSPPPRFLSASPAPPGRKTARPGRA